MVLKWPIIKRLYGLLTPRIVVGLTASYLLGVSVSAVCMYKLVYGDEHFHREWVIPVVHRLFKPETAHIFGIMFVKTQGLENFAENRKEYPVLACQMFGKQLNNPIGLAAGFDKNGEVIGELRNSGFGFVEIGTVTPLLQVGNRLPRVFRLMDDEAVINSYGFNNDGIGVVLGRVKKASDPNSSVPLGVNLGKNKDTTDAAHDFEKGITAFSPYSDYLVVNISSPNTPGLRELHAKKELRKLLVSLQEALQNKSTTGGEQQQSNHHLPHLFVKISPDLTKQQMADVAEVCTDRSVSIDGLIVTNTTMQRSDTLKDSKFAVGGLSGTPLRQRSTECIAEMYRLTRGQIPIIGCGGISSGADAYEKIRAGASAVQLHTALAHQGFPVIGRVKRELAELLAKDGYEHVTQAVGAMTDYVWA